VQAGLRPEAFEDARLVGDRPGHVFDADVELVESLGSDIYVHLAVGSDGDRVVARLSSESPIREPGRVRLWLDPERLQLFDAESGQALDR
jgi:multiple sugar transport system ATP-binding protein